MWREIFVICSIIGCNWITADVSHLKSSSASKTSIADNHNHFSVFHGYEYSPPAQQLPSPAPFPYPPSSTTFLPEIIVNKGIYGYWNNLCEEQDRL